MKKILIIDSNAYSVLNFRYHLVKRLREKNWLVIVCAPLIDYPIDTKKRFKELGVKFFPIKLKNTSLNIFSDIQAMIHLYQLIKAEQPNLILNYNIKPLLYGSLVAWFSHVKHIYSNITGLGYLFIDNSLKCRLLRFFIKPLYRLALKVNKNVFFQNEDDLKLFVNSKLVHKAKTILLQGSGVDLDYFSVLPFPKICSFLFAGRLITHKGIHEYIKASEYLKRKYPYVSFKLAGKCHTNPASLNQQDIDSLVERGLVDYLGFQKDIRSVLSNTYVFVLPSYREGTSHAVLEAMSTGRPIITTDAPGCRNTVENGVNGYLVPIKNVDALIKTMEQFILKPHLIKKMGAESRRIAEAKYDVHKVNALILKVIERTD